MTVVKRIAAFLLLSMCASVFLLSSTDAQSQSSANISFPLNPSVLAEYGIKNQALGYNPSCYDGIDWRTLEPEFLNLVKFHHY